MNRKRKNVDQIVRTLAAALLLVGLAGCEALPKRNRGKIPGQDNGFLAAKVVAYRHAMSNMSPDSKRFGSEFYVASGIADPDETHAKVLIAALSDMHPPVVPASRLYTRSEGSKWMDTKPAIVWTSKVRRVTKEGHVIVQLGWMHSNLIHEFFEYETRYLRENDAWDVVDYQVIEDLGSN